MKKSELRAELRKRRVFNDWEFFRGQPYIYRVSGGDWSRPSWNVIKEGVDLGDGWHDHGAKHFTIRGRSDITAARLRAQEWASEKFGVEEWAIGPYGAYGSKDFIENRIKELLAKPLD